MCVLACAAGFLIAALLHADFFLLARCRTSQTSPMPASLTLWYPPTGEPFHDQGLQQHMLDGVAVAAACTGSSIAVRSFVAVSQLP